MTTPRVLVLACGALARELLAITGQHGLGNVTVECLPAILHNRPGEIPAAVEARLDRARGRFDRILLGYADCGTAGALADIADREGIEMLDGAHCYQVYAGQAEFDALHDDDPTAFYLTDYLVRHFDRIILDGLGIEAHPELRDAYFGNYTKMIHLAQTDDPVLDNRARACAERLDLAYVRRPTTYGELEPAVVQIATRPDRVGADAGAAHG